MRVRHLAAATLEVSGIGFIEGALRWRLAAAADPSGSAAAEQRLASTPTGGTEPGLDADWKEHVLPELRVLFSSAVEIVRMDLARSWISPGTDLARMSPARCQTCPLTAPISRNSIRSSAAGTASHHPTNEWDVGEL